jgi:hypothetical protein
MVPNLPLWLDEGLAEYFEVPRGQYGMSRAHLTRLLARLQQDQWQPDLQRLEQFSSTFDMTQDDYAEAWAWAHFLLHSSSAHCELLQHYLGEVRRDGAAEPLSLRLGHTLARPEAALVEHVRHLGVHGRRSDVGDGRRAMGG